MSIPSRRCDVIVGNIGTVCVGVSLDEANRIFREYVAQSKLNAGRASGESVLIADSETGDPIKTYYSPKDLGTDLL